MRMTLSAGDGPPRSGMVRVVGRNIRALLARRRHEEQLANWQDRLADRITAFTGSMRFVSLHLGSFGLWSTLELTISLQY